MKKSLLCFALVLCMAVTLFPMAAFADGDTDTCTEHSWSEWQVLIPGCVTNSDLYADEYTGEIHGVECRVCCNCGEIEYRNTPHTPGDHKDDPFSDIASSGLHDYIIAANILGIVSGFEDGTFRPRKNVTRAQFVTMLWRIAEEPQAKNTELTFADTDQIAAPFRAAVAWGVEEGIIAGFTDGTFRPRQDMNRGQMATFLYRFCVYCSGGEKVPDKLKEPFGFVDAATISPNFIEAVNVMANLKILSGVDNAPNFNPRGTANRGMASVALVRLYLLLSAAQS